MLARLGIVLYRLGCVIAGLCLVIVLVNLVRLILGDPNEAEALFLLLVFLGFAFIIWLAGLTLRYILAGRKSEWS